MSWEKAQAWETAWHGSCTNSFGEETKQILYAKKMGLEFFHDGKSPFNIDMKSKAVLDIGGGPASLLLKCQNLGKGKVIDPMLMPRWVYDRYDAAGIEHDQKKAEELDEHGWDEVLIYNVLQHTDNPELVIANALKAGKTLRIFEWIDTVQNEGHPHILTEAWLNQMLKGKGTVEMLNGENECNGKCYYGVFNNNHLVDKEHSIAKNKEIWEKVPWEGANLMGESWSPSAAWKDSLIEEFKKLIKPNSTVLEIGPGAGRFTEFLQQLASQLTLVDLADKCISLCKERFKDCNNIRYFVNDGADLSFIESNSQDYIFSFDCFNHMSPHDIEKYVVQFPRILKDNGICVIDHGTKGAVGGWRSSLTNEMFFGFLKKNRLNLVRQFDSWGEGYQVAQKHDTISVISKAKTDGGHQMAQKQRPFRFFLLGLAHLPVSDVYNSCAFTMKAHKLSRMLLSLGHEVYVLGAEGSNVPCTEFIQTHTLQDIRDAWGDKPPNPNFELAYDWQTEGFRHDFAWKVKTDCTKKYYTNCMNEIHRRKNIFGRRLDNIQPHGTPNLCDDFLLITQGEYQRPIAETLDMFLTCEPGVGYRGSFCRFRAFESSYLQNFTYGSQTPFESINGNYYDRVISNFFDPQDFPFCEKKDDYFLYMGRMINRKGVWTAVATTQAIGAKLILAGQQSPEIDIKSLPKHCEFVGYADAAKRAELLGHARAVFVPTLYLEAFGGVNVEAQLCGTPAITTNFSVFPETVLDGVTGFRCNTLNDFVEAAKKAHTLDPHKIRAWAERYLMDNVKWEYDRWFKDLYQLYLSATVPNVKGWQHVGQYTVME